MSYNAFIMIQNQLTTRKKARCHVEESLVEVGSCDSSSMWCLSTKIFDGYEDAVPELFKESVSARGLLRFQEKGAYLQLDPDTHHIYLKQEIRELTKYLAFRSVMNDFAKVAKDWKKLLIESDVD